MSEDFQDNPAEVPAAKAARKKSAPRKTAKPKPVVASSEPAPQVVEAPVKPPSEARPVPAPQPRESEPRESGPEPIPFFVENTSSEPPGNTKKRRRRKKKHGQPQGQHSQAAASFSEALPAAAPPHSEAASPAPVMHAAPRPKLDTDEVAKKAWKIFLSEVGEEGLALIDDHDAREISRRCFRLAEVFLEEAARRNR